MWRDTITVRLFASEAEMMIFKATFEGGAGYHRGGKLPVGKLDARRLARMRPVPNGRAAAWAILTGSGCPAAPTQSYTTAVSIHHPVLKEFGAVKVLVSKTAYLMIVNRSTLPLCVLRFTLKISKFKLLPLRYPAPYCQDSVKGRVKCLRNRWSLVW
jgi:hypothetical protein